ncbi:hypothetical protein ACFQ6N_32160 [Kitasatospora sp. NPDC056446]|uniref:hypothetical protein n=1 Tax=Kitasatospora sp. NPDC056446 TaxID=3345819 RepID=UPI0036CE01DD
MPLSGLGRGQARRASVARARSATGGRPGTAKGTKPVKGTSTRHPAARPTDPGW